MKMSQSNTPQRGNNSHVRKRSKKSPLKAVIITILVVLLTSALVLTGLVIRKYNRIKSDQQEAQSLYKPQSSQSANGDVIIDESKEEKIDPQTGVIKDFNQLYEVNNDTIGWISIPDTGLDLPVVKGQDNEYYLYRNIRREKAPLGVPFADYRAMVTSEDQSDNLTIYGHAASNGAYFAPVKEYKSLDFYQKHPTLIFNTIFGNGTYKIVAAYMEDVNGDDSTAYHDKIDMQEAEFNQFIEDVKVRSYFTNDVDVKYGDKLVTLSTCDTEINSTDKTPYRMVLVARKVRNGESTKVDISKTAKNANQRMPASWYEKKGIANPFN